MFAIFRNHNPFAVIALFILTILTRIVYINNNYDILPHQGALIWSDIITWIQLHFHLNSFILFVLLTLSTFAQAIYINRIASRFEIYPKLSYLPAATFILYTALLPEFNQWNIYVIVNWLLLFLLKNTLKIYNTKKDAVSTITNMGIITGILCIIYIPAIVFLILAIIGLSTLRAFKPKEWIAFLIGCTLPFYLFVAYAYLSNNMYLVTHIPYFDIELWKSIEKQHIATIVLLSIMTIIGFISASNVADKMVMEGKKYWILIITYFIFSCIATFLMLDNNYAVLLLPIIPVTYLSSAIYFETYKKWIPNTIALILLVATFAIQWAQ